MFIGNAKAVKLLEKSIENGKISQAYLFSGPESVGKFTLAKLFAAGIIKGNSLSSEIGLDNPKNLPDLIVLEPEIEEKRGITREKDIKVEHIREVQKNLSLFPYSGKYRILVVNNAHKMTISAQNSLLKILEEPNETSIIILISHNDSKIISTIKSRCQKIKFSLVNAEEIGRISSNDIASFSMGRPGIASEMMMDKKLLEERKKYLEELKELPNFGINEKLKWAEKLATNTTEAIKKFEFWIWVIRFRSLETGEIENFKTIEKIEKSLETIKNTNANVRLVIENLLLEIYPVK